MKKVLNEAMINVIAKRMRKHFEEGKPHYYFYYNIVQEAIEEVTEQDDLIKRIDIGKEFTEYINNVLSVLDYPSRYELDGISQTLINSLYNVFFECLESIVEDVKEEYTDVNINVFKDSIIVITTADFENIYIDEYYSAYYYSKERELIINDLKDVEITEVKELPNNINTHLGYAREIIIDIDKPDYKFSMTLEALLGVFVI